jgi:hypothetical protein
LQELQEGKEFHDRETKILYHFYNFLEKGRSRLEVIGILD